MNSKKLQSIIQLPSEERYSYTLRKIADFEELWSLKTNEGWAMSSDRINQIFPIWPEKEFAQNCCSDAWQNYKVEKISLQDFLSKWIPGLTNDQILIAVFPVQDFKGIVISPDKLHRDLLEELNQYE